MSPGSPGPSECTTVKDSGKRQMHVVLSGQRAQQNRQRPGILPRCSNASAAGPVPMSARSTAWWAATRWAIHLHRGHRADHHLFFPWPGACAKNLVQNCTNCGACKAICAGGIDLPNLIKEVHARDPGRGGPSPKECAFGQGAQKQKTLPQPCFEDRKAWPRSPLTEKTKAGPYLAPPAHGLSHRNTISVGPAGHCGKALPGPVSRKPE